MWHNRFYHFSLFVIFSLYLWFSLCTVCYAAEDIYDKGYGSMNLSVKADFMLKDNVLINISNIKDETEIYLITGESKNQWKVKDMLPVGHYKVNYVTIGDGKNTYTTNYPETLIFKAGEKTNFEVIVNDKSKLGIEGKRGFVQIIKDNTLNLILILTGIILLLVLKRRKDKKYE